MPILSVLTELGAYGLILYWTAHYFELRIDWEKKQVESKTAFTYHEFMQWLRMVTLPLVGIGFLSLAWEILLAGYRSACIRGFLWKLWASAQWAIFSTAALGMFTISLVPFTYIEYESNGKLWPAVHQLFSAVDRYQLANSYGLFRRMTGVGGRPEVVVEGSYDKKTWTEIEFMYKPGNVSAPPPVVIPHQPRLDWQMWFAALGHHTHSPWFTSFVYRLLQGKEEVIHLVQADDAKYPFRSHPPTYIRAQLFRYWFTEGPLDGSFPQKWWRRKWVEEFYPVVSLGDPNLDALLAQHGLKDKAPPTRPPDSFLPTALQRVRAFLHPHTGPAVIWTLYFTAAAIALLRGLGSWLLLGGGGGGGASGGGKAKGGRRADAAADPRGGGDPAGGSEKNGQVRRKEEAEKARSTADPPADGLRNVKKKK